MMAAFQNNRRAQGKPLFMGVLAVLVAMVLCLPARALAADAADAADADSSALPASSVDAARDGGRIDRAIAACLAGLFEGWNVADTKAFYASEMLDVADGTCDWLAFDAYRAGLADGADAFLARMEDYTTRAYASDEAGLDPYSPTTWGRVALVVGTMGADPTAFGTKPDGSAANLLSDGLYNWAYTDDLGDQGSNAYIYALQALDALGADVPADAAYSVQDMLDGLLACQAEDGSFALSPGSSTGSVDLTGMALAALAPHAGAKAVDAAIERAVAYLSEQQQATGGFSAEGEETSESCAMVIVGLAACGIDPATDERFAKEDGTVVDALLSYQKPNGTFAHVADDVAKGNVRELSSEQALRALLALSELRRGGDGNVYTDDVALQVADLEGASDAHGAADVAGPTGAPDAPAAGAAGWGARLASMGIGAAAALVLVVAIWAIRRIRRKARR